MNKAERLDDSEFLLPSSEAPPIGSTAPNFGQAGSASQVLERRPEPQREAYISERVTEPIAVSKGGRGFRTVLRNRYFLRLWTAQLISQTIMNAANYGLIILVASQTQSVLGTAGAIVAFALPAALFGAPAGVLVDRLDRRTVLWVSNALRGGASFGFVLSLLINPHAFVPVLLLSFFMATVGQFFAPAEGAAIPSLVHSDELINALALFNITFTMAQALGLIILGPAIIVFSQPIQIGSGQLGLRITPIETLFILVGLLYIVCVLLILSIPQQRLKTRRRPSQSTPPTGHQFHTIWESITESGRFILHDRRLVHAVFQLCLGGTVIAIVATVAPTFVRVFFNLTPDYAALVFFPAGVGLVIGSALVPEVARRLHYARTVSTGIIMLGICAVLLPLTRFVAISALCGKRDLATEDLAVQCLAWSNSSLYWAVALFLIFLVGVALDLVNVPAQTLVQERSPDYIKGRVLALQGMVLNAVTVPAVLSIGVIADRFTLPVALETLAIIIVAAGLGSVHRAMHSARQPVDGAGQDTRLI